MNPRGQVRTPIRIAGTRWTQPWRPQERRSAGCFRGFRRPGQTRARCPAGFRTAWDRPCSGV